MVAAAEHYDCLDFRAAFLYLHRRAVFKKRDRDTHILCTQRTNVKPPGSESNGFNVIRISESDNTSNK